MNFPMKSVMDKIRSLIFLFLMVGSLLAFSKEIPTKPEGHDRFVNDYARMLAPDQVRALNNKLYSYWDSTSTEIVIVIEDDLGDDELFEYSQKLAQGWGIGQKGKNNGLLIYVAKEERAIRIHVGYGLEGAIPDFIAGRVIDNIIKPEFKTGQYGKGLNDGVDALIALAAGEFVFDEKDRNKNASHLPTWIIVVVIIIIIIIVSNLGSSGGRTYGGSRGPFFGGTGWGVGGFGGGGGGGGFGGGFGGGSFGGGGASGNW
jgi:uncharacterized protein